MKPLSKNKRRGYFISLCIVFVIGAPLFVLNARGYRLNWNNVLKPSQTGGLYISTDQSGIEIYVDRLLVKETSIVQKSIFVPDIKPGMHEVNVSKDGLQSWNKTLKVFPEIVTEARSFLMKSSPELLEIPRFFNPQTPGAATSSKEIPLRNMEYDAINALFLPLAVGTTSSKAATTSPDDKILNNMLVKNDTGKLHVFWTGKIDLIPNYFCENIVCKSEIIVNTASRVLSYDLFPGRNDILILRLADGIYVSEIDDRSPQNIQKIVSEPGYDFRTKDGKIYLKRDEKIYAVSP